jgi:cell division protein FtsB
MRKITKKWQHHPRSPRFILLALAAVLVYVGYSYLGGSYGFYNLWRLHRQKSALRAELATLQARQDSLQQEISRLQSDTTYIEELARKKYYMGKPGENIYIIAKKEKP